MLMDKPPIPLAIAEAQLDEAQKKPRKRKIMRACLIIAAIVIALWIAAELWFNRFMRQAYPEAYAVEGLWLAWRS